jgi:hypothetical protein
LLISCDQFPVNDAQVTYGLGPQASRGVNSSIASSIATTTIDLDSDEYFVKVSGLTLTNPGSAVPVRVASLTFTTNKQAYGPFGVPTIDKPFEVQGPVYALHGAVARRGMTETLSAIGFWKLPVSKQPIASGSWSFKG